MTLEQKIGQFFFPAVFINDTEEKIQEEKIWFEGLAKSMKRSNAEEKGNVEEVQEVLSELNLLHTTLNLSLIHI